MNVTNNLPLQVLPEGLAVCRLSPEAVVPEWARPGELLGIIRTREELCIICAERFVPPEIKAERGWMALRVEGLLDFSMTGILASISDPLAQVNISIFAISTFDTDYVLVKKRDIKKAVQALRQSGFQVMENERISS